MNKVQQAADRLEQRVREVQEKLSYPAADFLKRPAPGKWSKMEELGHLIDSANNNHQRFVRGQFEARPQIGYKQDEWVSSNRYQEMDPYTVIELWTAYNTFIVSLMRKTPVDAYPRECVSGDGPHTLEWLMVDYVDHVDHHLDRILGIDPPAKYPLEH
jgi:hypothetical protein